MTSEHLLEGAGDVISYEEWEMGTHTHSLFLNVFLGVCVCHGMRGEVRGQLAGVGAPLLACGSSN